MSFLMPEGWGCEVAEVSIGEGEGQSGEMMSLTSDKTQEMRIDKSSLLSTRGSRSLRVLPSRLSSYLVCLGHR